MQMEQLRRWENANKLKRIRRAARAANGARQKLAKTQRKLEATAHAAEQAAAQLLTAEIVLRATKALIDADGDIAVLLPEELDVLLGHGYVCERDGELALTAGWLEAYAQIQEDPEA
jgi:hypothetical protein